MYFRQRFLCAVCLAASIFAFVSAAVTNAATVSDGVLTLIGNGSTPPIEVRDTTTDALLQTLESPSPEPIWDVSVEGNFGQSLAVDSPIAVVGTPAPFDIGRAFVYNAVTGELLRTLVPTGEGLDGRTRPQFGSAVAIDNDLIAVAANNAFGGDFGGVPYVGAVYLFETATGRLVEDYLAPELTDLLPEFTSLGTDIELLPNEVRIQWSDFGTNTGWLSFPRPVPEPTATMLVALGCVSAGFRRRHAP